MNRRAFMLLAATAAIDRNPAAAEAKMPRIGFIQAGFRQDNQGLLDSFGQALATLGWTDSSTIAVLDRWAEERTERLPAIVKELIGSGVRVLVTAGTPATLAAKGATTTMPIVMVGVGDPVGLGVVASLGQPGGNVTGLSLTSSELTSEQLALLRELVPGMRRLAVIVRNDPGLEQRLRDLRSDAQRKGIEALMLEASTGTALRLSFARLHAERCEAVYVASGPLGPDKPISPPTVAVPTPRAPPCSAAVPRRSPPTRSSPRRARSRRMRWRRPRTTSNSSTGPSASSAPIAQSR